MINIYLILIYIYIYIYIAESIILSEARSSPTENQGAALLGKRKDPQLIFIHIHQLFRMLYTLF